MLLQIGKIRIGIYLVSESVASNNNGFRPARHRLWDAFQDDGFTEDSSSKNVPDRAIGTLPHFLQFELLDTSLIWGNGCTFDTNAVLEDSLSGVDGNFVICLLGSEML